MRRARAFVALAAIAVAVVIIASILARSGVDGADAEIARLAHDRGRIALVGGPAPPDLARSIAIEPSAAIDDALDGTDEEALRSAMAEGGFGALLVARTSASAREPGASLRARLERYDALEMLRCLYLTPAAALYVPRTELALAPILSAALAHVARAVVGGAPVPRVQSFPEPLRRIRNVEVMVLLSESGRPRLWRSARGSSIARALLTAATVARQRWNERESAMGGPLSRVLPSLDVSVSLLEDDGTLGDRSSSFIESAFQPDHGVAFEYRGNWHYLLPDATRERGEGSAVRAYAALMGDQEMPSGSLERRDVRLYRSVARRLATSSALGSSDRPAAPTSAAPPATSLDP